MELLARTCKTERMNFQRILARLFLLFGGIFWVSAVFGARWSYQGAPLTESLADAGVYAIIVIVVFMVALFYETLAAILLAVAAVGVIVWGIVAGWEAGVWSTVAFFVLLPMLLSAALFAAAARMQRICSLV